MNSFEGTKSHGFLQKVSGSALAGLIISAILAFPLSQDSYAAVTIIASSDKFFEPSLVRIEIDDGSLVGSPADTSVSNPEPAIRLDRTTLPIPMPFLTSSSFPPFPAIPADVVQFTLAVFDPAANIDPLTVDTIAIVSTLEDKNGVPLSSADLLLNDGQPITLTEVGVNAGVFTKKIPLASGTAFSVVKVGGAKLKFTYADKTALATLASSDLSISTSKSIVKNGDTLVVALADADRNLDAMTVDRISFNVQAVNPDMPLVTFDAMEIGPNAGVFAKTLVVGTDFMISTTAGGQTISSTLVEIKSRERVASDLTSAVIREKTIGVESPPVCTNAAPSRGVIFVPDHLFRSIAVTGVTDPDNDPIKITITGIFQDEPTRIHSLDPSPDGSGVGTSVANVRAERAAGGDGRVYHIFFRAEDEDGSCTGQVLVRVPITPGSQVIDQGPIFDSTKA